MTTDPLADTVHDTLDFELQILRRKAELADSRGILHTCRGCRLATPGKQLEHDRNLYGLRLRATQQAGGDASDVDVDDLHLGCLHCDGMDLAEERIDVEGWLWSLVRLRAAPVAPLLIEVRKQYAGKVRTAAVAQIAATWAGHQLRRTSG